MKDKHQAWTVCLDDVVCYEGDIGNLTNCLTYLALKPRNCKACGGLQPELKITYGGRTFWFTCFKVEDKNGVVAETDYKQLGKWCEYKQRKKDKKK